MSGVWWMLQGYFLPLPKAFTDGKVTVDDVKSLVRDHPASIAACRAAVITLTVLIEAAAAAAGILTVYWRAWRICAPWRRALTS